MVDDTNETPYSLWHRKHLATIWTDSEGWHVNVEGELDVVIYEDIPLGHGHGIESAISATKTIIDNHLNGLPTANGVPD